MMIEASVILDNPIWKKRLKNPKIYIKKRLNLLIKSKIFKYRGQKFTLLLTGSKTIKNLNYKFRKKNKSTDVLSFPFNYKIKKNSYLGDIAINYDIINKRSAKSNFLLEFDKMWVHGYLHLLGYDHKKIKDFKKMKRKENLILDYFHRIN